MLIFVFPGQGSQKKGMGESLFDDFKDLTEKADAILGYSIKELCVDDPNNQLGRTQFTQPALYVVNALSYLKKIETDGIKPDFTAGHSLGEYNALFAAEVYDFETGLALVKKRSELMGRASGGGMAAVIGLNAEKVEGIITENGLTTISISNYNTPSQLVVAGPKEDIENARDIFGQAGARAYLPLKVSGAFHSRYMKAAREEFSEFIAGMILSEPLIPVISNVTARPYKQGRLKENLVQQITRPVKWTETIRYLMSKRDVVFEEIGPGRVLTGMIQKIKKEAGPIMIPAPD